MDGVLTHSKAVTIANAQAAVVTFNGANGDLLNCNTMYLAVSDTTAAGFILVVPSGISSHASAAVGNAASGTFGIFMDTREPLWFNLGFGRTTQAITIHNRSGAAKTVLVSYGIRVEANPISKGHSPGV